MTMHPDDESNLKAAFAELHRRQREQAPPFEAMRERAMRQDSDRQRLRHQWPEVGRIARTATAIFITATGMWWIGQSGKPALPETAQLSSTERVDELITAIEQHLEQSEPASFPEYPTDILLAGTKSDFSQ